MIIYKTVKVRLYPTTNQEILCIKHCNSSRFVYNWGLAKKMQLYEAGEKINYFELCKELTLLRKHEDYLWLKEVSMNTLQQSLLDLDNAYKRFFTSKGKFPKFKKKHGKNSFRSPQDFEVLTEVKRVKLPKIGYVKYRHKQTILGKVKSITVTRKGGCWYASILTEQEVEMPIHPSKSIIGLDVGIKNLLTTYDGVKSQQYHHSKSLTSLVKRLPLLHQRVSRKQKGGNNRKKAALLLSKFYQRIANVRLDTLHKLSTDISKNHAVVIVEDLKIRNMSKSASGTVARPGTNVAQKRGLNRAIMNQGWGILFDLLVYKTHRAGGIFGIISPMHTSQTCPKCLHVSQENRVTQARFSCVKCNFTEHADVVGAMNIRKIGLLAT